jgi:hypothetical protein
MATDEASDPSLDTYSTRGRVAPASPPNAGPADASRDNINAPAMNVVGRASTGPFPDAEIFFDAIAVLVRMAGLRRSCTISSFSFASAGLADVDS